MNRHPLITIDNLKKLGRLRGSQTYHEIVHRMQVLTPKQMKDHYKNDFKKIFKTLGHRKFEWPEDNNSTKCVSSSSSLGKRNTDEHFLTLTLRR